MVIEERDCSKILIRRFVLRSVVAAECLLSVCACVCVRYLADRMACWSRPEQMSLVM